MAELQEEMARGATALEELSAQLEEERLRTNPVAIKSSLQKVHIHVAYDGHKISVSKYDSMYLHKKYRNGDIYT